MVVSANDVCIIGSAREVATLLLAELEATDEVEGLPLALALCRTLYAVRDQPCAKSGFWSYDSITELSEYLHRRAIKSIRSSRVPYPVWRVDDTFYLDFGGNYPTTGRTVVEASTNAVIQSIRTHDRVEMDRLYVLPPEQQYPVLAYNHLMAQASFHLSNADEGGLVYRYQDGFVLDLDISHLDNASSRDHRTAGIVTYAAAMMALLIDQYGPMPDHYRGYTAEFSWPGGDGDTLRWARSRCDGEIIDRFPTIAIGSPEWISTFRSQGFQRRARPQGAGNLLDQRHRYEGECREVHGPHGTFVVAAVGNVTALAESKHTTILLLEQGLSVVELVDGVPDELVIPLYDHLNPRIYGTPLRERLRARAKQVALRP